MLKLSLQFFAHKKGVGSTKNGRDSNAQRLGVKKSDGEAVLASKTDTPSVSDIPDAISSATVMSSLPEGMNWFGIRTTRQPYARTACSASFRISGTYPSSGLRHWTSDW